MFEQNSEESLWEKITNKLLDNRNLVYIGVALFFALYNVLVFQVPFERNEGFWWGYGFTIVAFAVQVFAWVVFFTTQGKITTYFYDLPIISVAAVYLGVQVVLSIILMTISILPNWVGIVLQDVLTTAALVLILSGFITKNTAIEGANKGKEQIRFLTQLTTELNVAKASMTTGEEKKAFKVLIDKVRYCDPVGHESLRKYEEEMLVKARRLKGKVNKLAEINSLIDMIDEYAIRCKETK